MLSMIKAFIKKHEHVLTYLLFGALTTLVNYAVYFPLYNCLKLTAGISNIISWSVSVIFAYFTNKSFVFKCRDWSSKTVIPEFYKFVGCRIGSGLLETLIIWVCVDLLSWNGNLLKLIVSVLVVILNYVSSRWIVFKQTN